MKNWKKWLEERRAASTMRVKEIPMHQAGPWSVMLEENEEGLPSHVGRPDKKFFEVIAVLITDAIREVVRWTQVMFKEATKPGEEGVVVLVSDGQGNYLVQAKADVGNNAEGCVFLAPSVQASRANLDQVHGGKRPPRAELLDGQEVNWLTQPADGARFWHKHDLVGVVVIDPTGLMLGDNERWFSETELREAHIAGEINIYLALTWLAASKR